MGFVHRIDIDAPAGIVFAFYEDVGGWPDWDRDVQAVDLPGGLKGGATGWLKAPRGPRVKIRVAELVPGRSFIMESRLPFCRLQFGHDLQPDTRGTVASHWVQFLGPLAFLFRRLMSKSIRASLPETLLGLKRVSEGKIVEGTR
ncbi:hypothetical protein D6851_13055 [Altericroceibacterium spongiae]|uniref:Polyketide cyclase n=1 Tax=Altericroceibacterium spongiae TaxID=2320269 RepID=A0A420EFH2_9SPHN|nr:SRPBCC family protein [Altericroceibacterium spongiae]RKF19449.1 hypothetical protein D6851_13055 [Altericroceibacterium spongiae]